MSTIATITINSDDDAFAVFSPDLDAAGIHQIESELAARGFELMSDSECPAELTEEGNVKVWACRIDGIPSETLDSHGTRTAFRAAVTLPLSDRHIAEVSRLAAGQRAAIVSRMRRAR